MLKPIVTHYAPADQPHDFAYCGLYLSDPRTHSPQPTCPDCAKKLAQEDAEAALEQAIDETPWPLDADEAATELEHTNSMSPLGAQLFTFAVTVNRLYAAQLRKRGGR